MTGEMLPGPPSSSELSRIGLRDDEVVPISEQTWWRVHRTEAEHSVPWNAFRTFGPVARFDPHPQPPADYPDVGVWYGASTPKAALGEAFQADRVIDRSFEAPHLTSLRLTRPTHVLDLATDSLGDWATRSGGTYAFSSAEHAVCRSWARAICDAFPTLAGIRYNSRFAGAACVALFRPSQPAMPTSPVTSRALTDPALALRIAAAADSLGYRVV